MFKPRACKRVVINKPQETPPPAADRAASVVLHLRLTVTGSVTLATGRLSVDQVIHSNGCGERLQVSALGHTSTLKTVVATLYSWRGRWRNGGGLCAWARYTSRKCWGPNQTNMKISDSELQHWPLYSPPDKLLVKKVIEKVDREQTETEATPGNCHSRPQRYMFRLCFAWCLALPKEEKPYFENCLDRSVVGTPMCRSNGRKVTGLSSTKPVSWLWRLRLPHRSWVELSLHKLYNLPFRHRVIGQVECLDLKLHIRTTNSCGSVPLAMLLGILKESVGTWRLREIRW